MTTTVNEVPLVNAPQTLSVSLGGTTYNLRVTWCLPAAAWVLDVADADNNTVLAGVPLVTGANLLEQYAYLGIGGQIIVQTDADTTAVPTFTNLGTQGHLYYLTSNT